MTSNRSALLRRRQVIALGTLAAGSALAAACGQAPATATETVTTSSTAAPSATSARSSAASASAATTTLVATTSTSALLSAATSAPASATAVTASTTAPAVSAQQAVTWSCYNLGEPAQTRWTDTFLAASKATGIKVNVSWEPSDKYWDRRQAEVAANSPVVDIMNNQLNWVIPGGLEGMFVDHFEYMRRDHVDPNEYFKTDIASWSWKGKLWAIPKQSGGEIVFYNKTMFDAKGVPYPKKDWTYDDLLETCRKLNDPQHNVWAIDIGQNSLNYMMQTFVLAWGGQMLDDAKDQALYGNDNNAITGAGFDVDLITKYQLSPSPEVRKTVPNGKSPMDVRMVPMEINGAFRHVNLRQYLGAESLDFAPPPKGPAAQRAAVAGNGWSMLAPSKVKDAAWAVLHWIHTTAGMLDTPQIQAVSWPPLVSAASAPQWLDQFKGTHIMDAVSVWQSGGHDIIVVPEGDAAWSTMDKPIADARAGPVWIRDAMEQSASLLNALFAKRPAAWK